MVHKIPVGVLGASGYAGRELCALIQRHAGFRLAYGGAHVPSVLLPLSLFMHLMIGPGPRPLVLAGVLLVLFVPVASTLVDLPGLTKMTGARRTAVRWVAAALVALAAIGVALGGHQPM